MMALPEKIRDGLHRIMHLSNQELLARHERMRTLYAEALAGGTFDLDGADAILELGKMIFGDNPPKGKRQ